MRRWLNRDVLEALKSVGWGFDNRVYDDRVRKSLSFFFFFPNRLVAAAPVSACVSFLRTSQKTGTCF